MPTTTRSMAKNHDEAPVGARASEWPTASPPASLSNARHARRSPHMEVTTERPGCSASHADLPVPRLPSRAPSVRSVKSTASITARIRQAEYEAEKRIVALQRKKLEAETEMEESLIRRKLAVDVAMLQDYEENEETEQESDDATTEGNIHHCLRKCGPETVRPHPSTTRNPPHMIRGEGIPVRCERRATVDEPQWTEDHQNVEIERRFKSPQRYRPSTPPNTTSPVRNRSPDARRQRSPIRQDKAWERLADALEIIARSKVAPRQTQELPPFSGSAVEWLPFKAAMRDSTKVHGFTPVENLARLRSCLRGEAREAVSALLFTATDPQQIMKTLEQCFGRPEVITDRALNDIRHLQRVGNSASEMNTFAIKLQNIVCVLQNIDQKGYLRNPMLIREVIEKLTPHLRSRWCDYAENNAYDNEPEIVKLSAFMMREADRALRHAYSGASVKEHTVAKQHGGPRDAAPRRENKGTREVAVFTASRHNKMNTMKPCICCGDLHKTVECSKIEEMNVDQRWEWTKTERICYRCLNSRHPRYICKAKSCGIDGCVARHNPLLHRNMMNNGRPTIQEGRNENEATVLSASTSNESEVLLKVCPVTVFGPKGSEKTYALLDEGSTISLIDDELAQRIGANGIAKELTIKGVTAKRCNLNSRLVKIGIRGEENVTDYPMNARTVSNLKLCTQTVASKCLSYAHLRDLPTYTLLEKAQPQVLIGADYWHLIASRELRIGRKREPVASKTLLGWTVQGTVPRIACNQTETVLHLYNPRAHHSNNVVDETTRVKFETKQATDISFTGPQLLHGSKDNWPKERTTAPIEEEETVFYTTVNEMPYACLPDVKRFSSFEKLISTTARVILFVDKLRKRASEMELEHMLAAERLWIKCSQDQAFGVDILRLQQGKALRTDSKLKKLEPLLVEGVLRARGRIKAANVSANTKRPIILDARHPFTRLLVARAHKEALHANRETVVNNLRQKYWITRLRPTVKAVEKECALCRIRKAAPRKPVLGDLRGWPQAIYSGNATNFRGAAVELRAAASAWEASLREYLPTLVPRGETRDENASGAVKPGSLVIIVDANLPRNVWLRGVVIRTFPGADGIVRNVEVRTQGGLLRRPVRKLAVLPIQEEGSELAGGRMLRTETH